MSPARLIKAHGGRRPWLVAVPLFLILAIVLADVATPSEITLSPLLAVAPAITASFARAGLTAAIGGLAVLAEIATDLEEKPPLGNGTVATIALVSVSVAVVLFAHVRERYSARCTRAQSLALTAQKAVLRPLPDRLGQIEIATVYLAAEAEAVMGGDLYAAARSGNSTRLVIGDVRGKGMNAVSEAALVLGAFHATAHRTPSLNELVATLDDALTAAPEPAGSPRDGEEFVTALLVDVPDQGGPLRVAVCGHPPLVVVRDGRAISPVLPEASPPLGLGIVSAREPIGTVSWSPGDIVLLCTDGVLESRDRAGRFYPLAERIGAWPGGGPGSLVSFLRADLLRFTAGKASDDAALVAFRRVPAARPTVRPHTVAPPAEHHASGHPVRRLAGAAASVASPHGNGARRYNSAVSHGG
ncbi:PP2C family protein-serine/threonine phosphatase [Streptomyces sp. NPDC001288]|uniref:PP2C family protein-serine/threonine phosphatase n=1 Tax=unclassified Streptomyces TaxID=2593676 RepID=UPI00331E5339